MGFNSGFKGLSRVETRASHSCLPWVTSIKADSDTLYFIQPTLALRNSTKQSISLKFIDVPFFVLRIVFSSAEISSRRRGKIVKLLNLKNFTVKFLNVKFLNVNLLTVKLTIVKLLNVKLLTVNLLNVKLSLIWSSSLWSFLMWNSSLWIP